ncbi:Protein of unknown function [Acetitomaculum ruminis DSM 5522]|uniref:DUF2953 domain-containing protein n=1 Tax=Acetitomaculum ruminis DSM 5522 TaxID=1120918 RepID=A0A1I0VK77_9FIRM|nr:DUF2953 domain-containing protein [Acetitomaculum ruminis]SFA75966.1 Protein of unknown function [Acetitomaculum ruminis DSM 5522]
MLSILLTVLKILLIILGSLLALAFLIILLLLFFPFKYDVRAVKKEGFDTACFKTKVSWLFSLVSLKVIFKNKELKIGIYIFNILLKGKKHNFNKETDEKSDLMGKPDEIVILDKLDVNRDIELTTPDESDKNELKESVGNLSDLNDDYEADLVLGNEYEEPIGNVKDDEKETNTENRITNKFKTVVNFIASVPEKIKKFFVSIKTGILNIRENIDTIISFINDERNKKVFRFLKKNLKKALKHIFPRQISGKLRYGSDDPALTGEITGFLSFLLPISKDVRFIPDFQKKVLKGNIRMKGRIFLFYLLYLFLKVFMNKDCRIIYKKFKETGGND